MEQETTIYVTNLGIAAILACLLTQHWRQGRTEVLRWWMLAAWIMFVADVFFAARPELPYWVGRLVPTLLVTVGHAALFVGARLTARRAVPWGVVGGVVGAHALLLG
ncbi:MAG: hypothetical protein Q8M02_07580, partial [Candidatus Didemnitutus sp.]|nr:hypothetical protein [Candidatus Didemnitutus sp.]